MSKSFFRQLLLISGCYICSACFLLLFSFSTSPLFANEGMDSAVFKTMGLAILQGKVPYVDIFDHKGPLLYFINALGQWLIPGRLGIFILQVISLGLSLFLIFKTARLFTTSLGTAFTIGSGLLLLCGQITDGNLSEEWMLPYLCLATYIASRHLTIHFESGFPKKYALVLGACFGAVFLIRPNDAFSMIGGITLGIMLLQLYQKHYSSFFKDCFWFALGFCLVFLPFLIYFLRHDAIYEFYYGLIGFNASYSGGLKDLILSCVSKGKLSLSLLFVALLTVIYSSDNKRLLIFIIPVSLFTFLLMGIRLYCHYYIVLLPLISLLLANSMQKSNKAISVLAICIVFFSHQAGIGPSIKISQTAIIHRFNALFSGGNDAVTRFYAETDSLLDCIPEEEKSAIWNYNLDWETTEPDSQSSFSMLIHHNLVQCNKVTYGADDKIIEEDNIKRHSPKWVLKNNRMVPLWERLYLESPDRLVYLHDHYDLVARTDTTICDVVLYRKKD